MESAVRRYGRKPEVAALTTVQVNFRKYSRCASGPRRCALRNATNEKLPCRLFFEVLYEPFPSTPYFRYSSDENAAPWRFHLRPIHYRSHSTPNTTMAKKKIPPVGGTSFLVPVAGVEPARYRYHRILSPARLPIPSHRRGDLTYTVYHIRREKSRYGRKNLFAAFCRAKHIYIVRYY